MPRPKIGFLLQDFSIGGIESCLYGVAHTLRHRFDFHFLATHVQDMQRKFADVGTPRYVGRDWRALVRLLRQERFDVVQVQNLRQYGRCAFAAGVPVVVERVDGLRGNVALQPKWGYDAVIASARGVMPLFGRAVPKHRVHLIRNGVDLARFDCAAPDRLGFGPDDVLIGRTSRFGRGKNLGLLIEAVKRLRVKYDHVRLVLVGDNSKMPGAEDVMQELRDQAKPLGRSVVFTGAVEQVEPLIKGFDIGTCVSRPQNEGIPNSLLEAMAAGKPVVATCVDNIEEAVEDGRNGFLVESDNIGQLTAALERLVLDPALRARLGAEGRGLIEAQFTTTAQYAQYGELYERLIARRAQGLAPLARQGAWPEAWELARLSLERRLPL